MYSVYKILLSMYFLNIFADVSNNEEFIDKVKKEIVSDKRDLDLTKLFQTINVKMIMDRIIPNKKSGIKYKKNKFRKYFRLCFGATTK